MNAHQFSSAFLIQMARRMQSITAANTLIEMSLSGCEEDPLTQLRLQKLLYYVQGWSLAIRGHAAFSARIEAWKHGPVVKDVYPKFRDSGSSPIYDTCQSSSEEISEADRFFIGAVWNSYKQYSASALWEKTHNEKPWMDARAGLAADAKSDREISQQSLLAFFSELHSKGDGLFFKQMPQWDAPSGVSATVRAAAQRVFLKNAQALRRLA